MISFSGSDRMSINGRVVLYSYIQMKGQYFFCSLLFFGDNKSATKNQQRKLQTSGESSQNG